MSLFAARTSTITSLRLTQSDITVVSIDPKHQKILSLYQQALPGGVINRGEVTNIPQLVSHLKSAFTQAHALGHEIIIGFPEDRTLLGLIDTSQLPQDKLSEAMNWQAEEVFSGQSSNLYVDWQIITPKALLVAAPRLVIDGFITAVVQAGAKPISLEPTSVSLAKLIPSQDLSGVIEIRPSGSTLVIVSGKTVRLSTVVTNPQMIVSEFGRMTTFYSQKYSQKLTTIYLCGEGATKDWLSFLNLELKLPVQELPLPKFANLPASPLRFAVSLALIQTPSLPPKHPGSINLLPPRLELEYTKVTEARQLSFGFKASLVTTIITAAIMFITFIRIQLELASLKTQIASEEQSVAQVSYDKLAKQAESANQLARLLSKLPPKDKLATIITELNQAVPTGVGLNGYTVDLPQKVILVNGFAPTRDLLLKFKSNLETSKIFQIVTIPLPTLERQKDVEFSIAIDI